MKSKLARWNVRDSLALVGPRARTQRAAESLARRHLMWRHNVMFPSCRWACTTSTRWWAWEGWWTCRRAARRASSAPSTSELSSFNSIKRLKLSRSKRRCKEGKHTWCRETYISELNLIKKKTRWRWSLSILNLDATVYKIQLSVDDFGDKENFRFLVNYFGCFCWNWCSAI